jgi:hypothetical protein
MRLKWSLILHLQKQGQSFVRARAVSGGRSVRCLAHTDLPVTAGSSGGIAGTVPCAYILSCRSQGVLPELQAKRSQEHTALQQVLLTCKQQVSLTCK